MQSDSVNDSLIQSFNLLSDKLYQLKLLILFSDIPNKNQLLELLEEIGNIEFSYE